MKFSYKEIGNGYLVTVSYTQQKISRTVDKNATVNATVNALQTKILKMMSLDSFVTYDEMSVKLKKDRATIYRNIKYLVENNYISRVGSDKSGHWEINYKNGIDIKEENS